MNIEQPDIKFLKEIKKDSRSGLKQCMQCGNCSVVCDLSPDTSPFPRKEMIWAAWGLKSKLVADPDIWLCHQCGDCSVHCPRGVNPSDVLSSLRKYTIKHYAKPRFLAEICNNPVFLPLTIFIPAIIITAILLIAGTFHIPEGPVNYSSFFPHAYLNIFFTAIVISIVFLNIKSLHSFWTNMHKHHAEKPNKLKFKDFISTLLKIIRHNDFRQCHAQKHRNFSHLLVFSGFILLLIVTLFAIFAAITGHYPMTLWHPVKITGNIAALFLLLGISIMIIKRLGKNKTNLNSSYADWFFLISFFLLTLSGVMVEIARFENWQYAYHLYFFHLITVWLIIMYAPYTKFGHFIYRTLAILYMRTTNRT